MKYSPLLILISLIFITACSPSIRYDTLTDAYAGSQSRLYPIKIYVTKLPKCDYEELGIVNAATTGHASSSFDLIGIIISNATGGSNKFVDLMRQQAVAVGGDAIVLQERVSVNNGMIETNPGVYQSTFKEEQSGVVIRFSDENCLK